jgi:hypothetical protein
METNVHMLETKKGQIPETHLCENCNKIFKNRSGLWKHKQKCLNATTNSNNRKTLDVFNILM